MSVILRWKLQASGNQTAYLDIHPPGGKRRKEALGIRIVKGDADARVKKRMAKTIRDRRSFEIMSNAHDLPDTRKQNKDVIAYMDQFLIRYTKAGRKKYIAAVTKFKNFLLDEHKVKSLSFKQLTPLLCQDFYIHLCDKSGLRGETPQDYFKRFKYIIKRAKQESLLTTLPTDNIRVRTPRNQLNKKILTIDELRILSQTSCVNSEVKRAFLFACFTGLGSKELRQLKWIHIEGELINTQRAKNGQQIINKLPPSAINQLGIRSHHEENVFTLPSETTLNKTLKKWVSSAGIEKHITFYCARHSYAVLLLSNGVNLKTVADLMGHSDTKHTLKYLNYVNDLKDSAIESLPEL